jgi:hypothetical protein
MTTTTDRKRPVGAGSDPVAGRDSSEGPDLVAADRPGPSGGVERFTTPGETASTLAGGG